MSLKKVFLSSTARDLDEYRQAVARAIDAMDGLVCIRMEDFGARDSRADAFCRKCIAECDVAVFLIGLCYGSTPRDTDESYTAQEYRVAGEAGVSRLVFVSGEQEFYPGYYREDDAHWQRQQRFRETVAEQHLADHFDTPEELARKVVTALSNWVAEQLSQAQSEKDPVQTVTVHGSGAIAQGDHAVAAGKKGVAIGGNARDVSINEGEYSARGHLVIAEQGATVVIGEEAPVPITRMDRESALGRYLSYVISRNRNLQLQGIRSGGKLVHIELDRIYIRLRATQQRLRKPEEQWLAEEAALAPGEKRRLHADSTPGTETVTVSVEQALADHPRLVVLGDPGSGKTTLLRYLTLPYARDLAQGTTLVRDRLGLDEGGNLPILLHLREIAKFLHSRTDDGTDGHAPLLEFLRRSLSNERIDVPEDFFDEWLQDGKALILFDGLDEVPDAELRRRVSRLVERFTQAYPRCRYVVTSRIKGYTGPARLGESYVTTTVRDFTLEDVERFLSNWHRLIAIGQMGDEASAVAYAREQTRQLMQAVRANTRIRELAVNPLMLTVIAMVHRDRVKLPDRRAELYAEALDVLLGKWEEAKGIQELSILQNQLFDTGDRRLVLQGLALHMHEKALKEIETEPLRRYLETSFYEMLRDRQAATQAVKRFLAVVEERTGLLVARGEGLYAFSHLTFQEYLAALAVAGRDDYIDYTLSLVNEAWWREVILLEAGFLSIQSRERTTRLIRAIADRKDKESPYHNLVLAAECLRDVGPNRVEGALEQEVQQRLRRDVEAPPPFYARWFKKIGVKGWIEHRSQAMEALVRAGAGFWSMPYGEPEWAEVPPGEFWMGSQYGLSEENPQHRLQLEEFLISRAPITNAQYYLFTKETGHSPPQHWEEDRPPKGLESHPVVNVSWHDAIAYCKWLSQKTGKAINLPSEAQWERAARGDKDKREYPWGNQFEATKCNCWELGLMTTTPVGIFPDGTSPHGCLDMVGNVWEWTRSLWGKEEQEFAYPYDPDDGREDLNASGNIRRVLRGGAFNHSRSSVRCACRFHDDPVGRDDLIGFRVVLSPFFSER